MGIQSEQYKSYKIEIARTKVQSLRNRMNSGEVSFLYQSVYLPVDSVIMKEKTVQEFSLKAIQPLGFDGWDIVGIVPKTLGLGLENSSFGSTMGTTWGGGIGGNVVGVYVLLKKEISAERNVLDEFLEKYISENIYEFATELEKQKLSDLLQKHQQEIQQLAKSIHNNEQEIAEPPLTLEEEKRKIEKLGIEVAVCLKCNTLNSLALVRCEKCNESLDKVKPTRNPYL
jgi:ribosomal protein L40E